MQNLKLIIALLIGLPHLCACFRDSAESTIVAKVGPDNISVTQLMLRLAQIPGIKDASKSDKTQTARQVLESLIDDHLLFLEAKRLGIKITNEAIEHQIRQHEALFGQKSLLAFTLKSSMTRMALWSHYEKQLSALEFLKRVQTENKPFCDAVFGVHSFENCIIRSDFLEKLRQKYPIRVHQNLIAHATKAILESGK